MKINELNFGAFVVDYYEGNLSKEEMEDLLLFIAENKEFEKEFLEFEQILLHRPEINYPGKEILKRNEVKSYGSFHEGNYEDKWIRFYEEEISDNNEINQFLLLNPHLKKEFEIFGKCYLAPDQQILYPDKKNLKKTGAFTMYLINFSRIAALFLLFIGSSFLLTENFSSSKISEVQLVNKLKPTSVNYLNIQNGIIEAKIKERPVQRPINFEEHDVSGSLVSSRNFSALEKIIPQTNIALLGNAEKKLYAIGNRKLNYSVFEEVEPKGLFNQLIASITPEIIRASAKANNDADRGFANNILLGYNAMVDRNLQFKKVFDEEGNIIAWKLIDNNELIAGISR